MSQFAFLKPEFADLFVLAQKAEIAALGDLRPSDQAIVNQHISYSRGVVA